MTIKFSSIKKDSFYSVVSARVNRYFEEHHLSKHANFEMILKTFVLMCLLFVPYALILSGLFNLWQMLLLALIMGAANAGLGMTVFHDATHGSYSANKTVNKILSYFFTCILIGGNPIFWKIQHNVLHHRYTNIHDEDDDIVATYGLIRFSPGDKRKAAHRYQYIYAFFLYTLMTFLWATLKEFFKIFRYRKMGFIKGKKAFVKEFSILIVSKIIYFTYLLIIPMMVLDITFWQWFIGFLAYHAVSGLILSIVFQMAHVVETTEFPRPTPEGNIENEWAVHQMATTTNFCPNNRVLTWYTGALNYQVEHHLFPNICHVHYVKITKIVQKTAKEFGVSYHSAPSFIAGLKSHIHLLKKHGQPELAQS